METESWMFQVLEFMRNLFKLSRKQEGLFSEFCSWAIMSESGQCPTGSLETVWFALSWDSTDHENHNWFKKSGSMTRIGLCNMTGNSKRTKSKPMKFLMWTKAPEFDLNKGEIKGLRLDTGYSAILVLSQGNKI